MFTRLARIAVATLLGALALIVVPLATSPASAAKCPYNATITTTTKLTLSPSQVAKGDTFTATATVTASAGGPPAGTVTFKYNGKTKTATLTPGSGNSSTASVTFVAKSKGAVKASYSGVCAAGSAAIGSSKSGPVILGIEASRGNGGAGVAGTSGALASTGASGQTELFGALGLGMILVGGLALVVHRRRVTS